MVGGMSGVRSQKGGMGLSSGESRFYSLVIMETLQSVEPGNQTFGRGIWPALCKVQTVLTFHNSGHGDPPAPWEEFWGVHSATRWGAGSALWNFLGDVLGETKALVSYFSS